MPRLSATLRATVAAVSLLVPAIGQACACGCGLFDVGSGTMMPSLSDYGASAWLRYSFMDQNRNWQGASPAPAADNPDKDLRTDALTFGGNYMIDRSWTVMADLPILRRRLTTIDDGSVAGPAGALRTGRLTDLGDLQLSAIYTGFSDDLSTGASFGVKLPTGNYTGPHGPLGGAEFDRDTLPGTGSTDLTLGAYHVGGLNRDYTLIYLAQLRYQFAIATRDGYRPGNELDGAVGLSYNFGAFGAVTKVAPTLQILGSHRDRDSGENADPANTGYTRLLIAPGAEIRLNKVRVFADIEFPFYQSVNAAAPGSSDMSGQLSAPYLIKAQISYDF